ncbi:MAG: helicase-associated domain-containing protein [Gemmataceae bacterium]
MKGPHVLNRSMDVEIDFDDFRSNDLKRAARFWIGKEASKFNKDECVRELKKVFKKKSLLKELFQRLSPKERQVVEIVARYGPFVEGELLTVEMYERDIVAKPDESQPSYFRRRDSVIDDLSTKFVLIKRSNYSYYSLRKDNFPDVMLNPAFVKWAEPAKPLAWQPSKPTEPTQSSFMRSAAEPALDLWRVVQALDEMGNWKTLKGNALSKGSRNKLRKLVPLPDFQTDELAPPDPESLYYELLREMSLLAVDKEPHHVLMSKVEEHFDQFPVAQAFEWVQAWLEINLWQDGIGVVPDRDNDYDPARIPPQELRSTKEMLVWALCRVAHSEQQWLDLEVFLRDFWNITHSVSSRVPWWSYTWHPSFHMAQQKDSYSAGPDRSFAFWLDRSGMYIANALMVTLPTLGLVERGGPTGRDKLPAFRLTELGRYVFGSPELEAPNPPPPAKFLTVQPNYDILAFYSEANISQICTLARFADTSSTSGGYVQKFTLTRESIYRALEDGMTAQDIETFLVTNGKTETPNNILSTLQDWSGKRESLVLRSGVTVALAPDAKALADVEPPARMLTETCAILSKMSPAHASRDYAGWSIIDHHGKLPRVWEVDEMGQLKVNGTNVVSQPRLESMADCDKDKWNISEKSVTRARKQGFTTEQILGWLEDHLTHATPLLLVTAIRNWLGRNGAFIGKVQMIQVTREEARDAILRSKAFEPLLVGHLPPDWFFVSEDKAAEAKRLLKRLGFRLDDTYTITPPGIE